MHFPHSIHRSQLSGQSALGLPVCLPIIEATLHISIFAILSKTVAMNLMAIRAAHCSSEMKELLGQHVGTAIRDFSQKLLELGRMIGQ